MTLIAWEMFEVDQASGAQAVTPRFHRTAAGMAPVVLKGLALTLLTLGLYRFWYVTDLRRFLWGETEIDGDGLEYLGRGVELFIGFLIALAVVIPLYVLYSLGTLFAGPIAGAVLQFAASIGFIVFAQYALFRARRYRLTRTVWRGLRMQQTGSGWGYAARSLGLGVLTVITLGLALPLLRANLERYKVGNTWYGDQRASFDATAWGLFRRGALLWLVGLALVLGPAIALGALGSQMKTAPDDPTPALLALGALMMMAPALAVIAAVYQAIEFRWWAEGCRFGETRLAPTLGRFAFLRVYLVFAGVLILFGLLFSALGAALLAAFRPQFAAGQPGAAALALSVLFYFAGALGVAALWQMFVVRPVWKKSFEGVMILNLGALAAAQNAAPPANAFGEGVADALHFGGF